MIKCSAYFAGFALLIMLGALPAFGVPTGSLTGQVRDSAGVPQIGAEVEVLDAGLSVIASAYTNADGRFLISPLMPGRYILKAMGPSFLPSQRENIKIHNGAHSAAVVNLTLYTLYEVIQWLPAQPRSGSAPKDDWAWTLRSASNRPLLRWLEDGPLVVDCEGPRSAPKLKARIMATGQAGAFGENGERFSTAVEDTPSGSRELLARVDFAPDSDAGMESMLGFRQDLGVAGSVQSVAALAIQPELASGDDAGLSSASARTSELMHFGEAVEAEIGSDLVASRLAGPSPSTATALLPYAIISWRHDASTIQYRMATMTPDRANAADEAAAWLPAIAERNGTLTIEHGFGQQIAWQREGSATSESVVLYLGRVQNPVLQANGDFASGGAPTAVLFDPASRLMRAAGSSYTSSGIEVNAERRLPAGSFVRVKYMNGDALVMPALPQPVALANVLASAHARRMQTYSISLSGTLDGTGTRWQASYSWQPEDAVTPVEPFAQDAAEPFMSVHLRQPIHIGRNGSQGMEALFDVQNLLAQGYRPYVMSDGSLLLFAEDQRSLRAGLAFTF